MTADEIIHRIRQEIDKAYTKYEHRPDLEKLLDDITDGFEEIITDYYEGI